MCAIQSASQMMGASSESAFDIAKVAVSGCRTFLPDIEKSLIADNSTNAFAVAYASGFVSRIEPTVINIIAGVIMSRRAAGAKP